MLNTYCPMCATEAVLMLRLDECDTIQCHECGEQITVDELRERVGQWSRLLQIASAAREALVDTEQPA